MREVVTSGTATVLASQPGLPVYGKTGTAEYGNTNPPQTDAWFIGYQGDIAFACLVAQPTRLRRHTRRPHHQPLPHHTPTLTRKPQRISTPA